MSDTNLIEAIIQRFGGHTATARKLGCSQSAVSEWVAKRNVPSHRIRELTDTAA